MWTPFSLWFPILWFSNYMGYMQRLCHLLFMTRGGAVLWVWVCHLLFKHECVCGRGVVVKCVYVVCLCGVCVCVAQLVSERQRSVCSMPLSQSWDHRQVLPPLNFYVGSGDLTSGLYACITGIVSTVPSPPSVPLYTGRAQSRLLLIQGLRIQPSDTEG